MSEGESASVTSVTSTSKLVPDHCTLTPLRRRSDPPCDGRYTPSPPEHDVYRRYTELNDLKRYSDTDVIDVFRARRLDGDGSEDCDVQSIPTELSELVKQVEDYAVLTGAISTPNTDAADPTLQTVVCSQEQEIDRDVNANEPLLNEHRTPIRSPRKAVKKTPPDEIHFKYDTHQKAEQTEYEELFNRLAALDDEEYGHKANRRTSLRKIHSAPVGHNLNLPLVEHKNARFRHSFGPVRKVDCKETEEAEKKTRLAREKDKFRKLTSFRQGSRHIKYYWDPTSLSPNVELLDNCTTLLRISHTASTDAGRGCMGFSTGKHVFCFKFNDLPWGTHCSVGVVRRDTDLVLSTYGHLLGKDELGWAWDLPSRQLIHNGPTGCTYPAALIEVPKEIQMTLDIEKGEISYQVDGVDLGVAFKGVARPEAPVELFPACACVYAMTEVNIAMLDSSHLVNKTLINHNVNNHIAHTNLDHQFASICSLSPDMRYLVEIAHGWLIDATNNLFFVYIPNNPTIILPRSFPFDCVSQEQLIAIRSRLGFTSGCHSWQMKEEFLMAPSVSSEHERDIIHNDMIIGVGTEEFCLLFENMRQPAEFLDHVTTFWGWQYSNRKLHNFYTKDKYYADNVYVAIDQGLTVVLDHDKGTLSFEHENRNLGVAFSDLPKEKLFPMILHINGDHPISLLYIDGPPEYLHTVIEDIDGTSFTRAEYQQFLGYVPLRHSPWISTQNLSTQRIKHNFTWDRDSMNGTVFTSDRKHCSRAICSPSLEPDTDRMDIIRGHTSVSEGTHVWTYTFSNNLGHDDHYLIGLVNDLFYCTDSTNQDNPLCHIWLWDLMDKCLYHGTELVAKYPVYPSAFEVKRYYRFQMAISMSKKTSFGFSAMAPHIPMDLGLAFSKLPPGKYYPCLVYRSGKLDCKLEYVKGPSGFIENYNKCCCLQ